ncbi:MAG: DUF6440 family protein [Oscillospiraceae bacterium]|nr:DUF6440 family protein [Oscillospiraceae bacterium]
MFGKKNEKRFEHIHKEGRETNIGLHVFRDTQTGVHYVVACIGAGGGITPLLDKDGKPVIGHYSL